MTEGDAGPPGAEPSAVGAHDAPPAGARCLILLGASNLARCLGAVVGAGQRACGAPLEIFGALGRGRSYGVDSSFLGRRLPAIVECGLWSSVTERGGGPVSAIVTDIGNDIAYGYPADQIAVWVEQCLVRLAALGARVAMTRPPVANLLGLSQQRFAFYRSLFFPGIELSLDRARAEITALDERIVALGRRHGATVVEQDASWYGLDPIHIRHSMAREAWRSIFASLETGGEREAPRWSLRARYRLLRLRPAQYVRGGRSYCVEQPTGVWGDTSLWLY